MQKQKIYRDKETAVIAGVLAGLAEYFNTNIPRGLAPGSPLRKV